MSNGEMKVADIVNWLLDSGYRGSVLVADKIKEKYSVGSATSRTMNGAWLSTWEVEKIFKAWLEDGGRIFRAMECEITIYLKDNPSIQPTSF